MRILVYEFASGGGFAGRAVPKSLGREGLAMRTALVADLSALGRHEIVTTTDIRFNQAAPPGVDVVPLLPGGAATLDALMASSDAVWLVAPETDRCLERLAARVERKGKKLLGPGAAVIRRASDKGSLPRRLARIGIRHPETVVLAPGVDARVAARQIGYPVVVKPGRGAGSQGVGLARDARELPGALDVAHRANGTGPLVMQRYLRGTAASVSLLADGRRAVALAVNAQRVSASSGFSYRGGRTPFDHPLAAAAAEAAVRTCGALPGLRGYVGVDLVLTDAEPVVIEVNPRLTTAYLGVRAVLEENVAALALAACDGMLPAPPVARRRVRFTAAGQIVFT
jgi:predicted ATP-grasp superfamily ATP-dependent carboligase